MRVKILCFPFVLHVLYGREVFKTLLPTVYMHVIEPYFGDGHSSWAGNPVLNQPGFFMK